jgi:FlaA1/EpsC-like NDP-sugar epimerase
MANFILAMPRMAKRLIVMLVDTGLCVSSVWLSFYLRLGEFPSLSSLLSFPLLLTNTVSVGLALPIFARFGLYRAIFRYSGISAMMSMVRAMVIYGLLFSTIFTFFY